MILCRCIIVAIALLLSCSCDRACTYANQSTVAVVRPTKVWLHHGNKKLDVAKLKYEIYQISKTLPNIRYSKNLSNLIIETIAVETNLGQANYLKNDHITKNYGLGQFVLSTAKHILKTKKKSDLKTYNAMMTYYDHSMDLKDNVRKNVKFTIALQLEYYSMCDKNLLTKISTVHDRARVWKKHYNTYHGTGTVNQYVACVRKRLGKSS